MNEAEMYEKRDEINKLFDHAAKRPWKLKGILEMSGEDFQATIEQPGWVLVAFDSSLTLSYGLPRPVLKAMRELAKRYPSELRVYMADFARHRFPKGSIPEFGENFRLYRDGSVIAEESFHRSRLRQGPSGDRLIAWVDSHIRSD